MLKTITYRHMRSQQQLADSLVDIYMCNFLRCLYIRRTNMLEDFRIRLHPCNFLNKDFVKFNR